MSRRAILLLAVISLAVMACGAAGGILLAQRDAGGGQRAGQGLAPATTGTSPAPTAPAATAPAAPGTTAPPGGTAATTPRATVPTASRPATATAATAAAPPATTGPPTLTARVATRLADGLVIRVDASQPLTEAVLHYGTGGKLDRSAPISGTVRHGTVTLPLADDQIVTLQVTGRTSRGTVVKSNVFTGQPLLS